MPEFEGNIEPLVMACSRKVEDPASGTCFEQRRGDRRAHRAHRPAHRALGPPGGQAAGRAAGGFRAAQERVRSAWRPASAGPAVSTRARSIVALMRRMAAGRLPGGSDPRLGARPCSRPSWRARRSPSSAGPRWTRSSPRAVTWPCSTARPTKGGSPVFPRRPANPDRGLGRAARVKR